MPEQTRQAGKLTEALFPDRLLVDAAEYMLGWMEAAYGPDSIVVKMQRAKVAAGRSAIEG